MGYKSRASCSRRRFLGWAAAAASAMLAGLVGCGRRRDLRSRLAASPTQAAAAPTATSALPTPTAAPPAATATVRVVSSPTAAPAATPLPPELGADMILVNGKVITVDPKETIAQAVAVKGGQIQAVGDNEAIRALASPQAKVIDLKGRTLTPGMVDAHNHLQIVGQLGGYYVPLLPPEVRDMETLRAKLTEACARTPKGEWVQGYFLVVSEGRLPNRHDLDPVSADHPIWLVQQGGHYGSANSMALRVANITSSTKDPEGGVIERDSQGQPTGVFYNHRAMDLLRKYIPQITPEMARDNILTSLPVFAAYGVTSFHDNNVRGVNNVRAYQEIGAEGKMTLHGAISYTLEWPGDLNRALKEIDYTFGHADLRFAGFKFLLDGQAQMAYCHQPHNGVRWDLPTWEPKSFKDAVRALHDTGLQIAVHCCGDAAVDLTLDAYEAAMNANPRPDPRHRIEHCILCTPQAVKRMKDLGVVVSTQPQFIRLGGDGWVRLFGEERARRAIVTREWLDAGVAVALGSDAPTTPWYGPQMTLWGALTRLTYSNQRHLPEQAMTIQEALRAHTMGSAYALHEEKAKGSIEPGKLADFTLWSQDPYTAKPNELWQIPIAMTVVGGRIVYQA